MAVVCWVDDDWRGYIFYSLNIYIYSGGLSAHTPSFMPVGRPAAIRLSNAKSPSKCSAVNEQLCPHNISEREGSEPPSVPNSMSFG